MRNIDWRWLVCLCVLFIAGCGGGEETAPDGDGEAVVEQTGVIKLSAGKLPKVANPIPPQDGGRIRGIAPPVGWKLLPRHSDFVARMIPEEAEASDLPRILITVAPVEGSLPATVTPENVEAFTAAVAKEVEAKKGLDEEPLAMVIGDNAFTRYVLDTKFKNVPRLVKRQMLETTFDGRRYTIVLDIYNEIESAPRDQAYAVAANLKFEKPEGGAAPMNEAEPAPAADEAAAKKDEAAEPAPE